MKRAVFGAVLIIIGLVLTAFALVGFSIGILAHDYVPLGIIIATAAMAVGGVALCFAGWWVTRRTS